MLARYLEIKGGALHTSIDSYLLNQITAVSARRPFWASGILIGGLSAAFAGGFWDILTTPERIASLVVTATSIWGGLTIGQLQLVSRDLRGSPMAEAVYGTYRDLNRKRREIAEAVQAVQRGDAS
jgi:hypothetical protein